MNLSSDVQAHEASERAIRDDRLRRVFEGLEADATQFDFYYAMRQIDAQLPGSTPLGRAPRPRDEPLRLTQHASLAFAPATLHSYKAGATATGLGRLSVQHFGLFGPNGSMPQHITEYVQERILHHKDETIARFCDVFQHRMLLLFYRAWADCQAVTSLDNPARDHFGRYVSSLIGFGQPSLRKRDTVPDDIKLHQSGHLVRPTRNAEGIVSGLRVLLKVPVAIREFCAQWLQLSYAELTRLRSVATAGDGGKHRIELGDASSKLGLGAIIGTRVLDVQHKFRLRLGPMKLSEFERFLPGGVRHLQVRDWVRNYVGVELAWDAQLVLERNDVPNVRLGQFGQLGWTSWLRSPAVTHPADAEDVILDIERLTSRFAG